MRLPINIEELLSGRAVEGDRIEYKTGWNPDAIYRTICAFANDFDETGGGYIVVGVKEENGHAIRPVTGIDPNQIEPIEKDMVGFNNLIRPYYQPRLYIEVADGKTILVIKVSPGERRPYKVPDLITAKQKTYNYYIRYNSSSIIPKDEYERELINLANRMPFDDRGNDDIKLTDISPLLLHDYLVKVKSSLADISLIDHMEDVLEQMDLLEAVPEGWRIKNVAAMGLTELNQRFSSLTGEIMSLMSQRNEEQSTIIVGELKAAREALDAHYRSFITYLNAVQEIQPEDSISQAAQYYNEDLRKIEQQIAQSKRKKKDEPEDGGSSDDSSDGGEVTPVQPENGDGQNDK